MNIIELKDRPNISGDIKLSGIYAQFGELLNEIEKKELSQNIIDAINEDVQELNSSSLTAKELSKLVKQKQEIILKLLEKEHKIVPIKYYSKLWMVVGMSAFGLPIGVVLGSIIGNMGMLAIGLPFGMAIGIAVGTTMDTKAANEGRQLDIEIKY